MASRSFLKSSKFGKRKANPSNHLGLLYESMRTGKSTEVELLVKEVTGESILYVAAQLEEVVGQVRFFSASWPLDLYRFIVMFPF